MADVAQKVLSANDIKQGDVVCAANKFTYQTIDPVVSEGVDTDTLETKYTDRFTK